MKDNFKCIAVRTNNALACLECDHPDGENCPVNAYIRDITINTYGKISHQRTKEGREHEQARLLGEGM